MALLRNDVRNGVVTPVYADYESPKRRNEVYKRLENGGYARELDKNLYWTIIMDLTPLITDTTTAPIKELYN